MNPEALTVWLAVLAFVSLIFAALILLSGWLQKRKNRDREK